MDYASILIDATAAIADTGRSVTLIRLSSVATDPAKPWNGPASPTVAESYSLMATFVPAWGYTFGTYGVTEEMLKRVNEIAMIASDGTSLERFSAIEDNGERYAIEWYQRLSPGDTALLYLFGIKR